MPTRTLREARPTLPWLVLLALLVTSGPGAAAAQEGPTGSSRIAGLVVDGETGEPLEGVALTLSRTGTQTLTSAEGVFSFTDLAPGGYLLQARHLAYGTVVEEVEVPWRSTVRVEIRLTVEPIELEPLVVTAVRDHKLEVRGFYERKEWGEKLGVGHYFTREELDRLPITRLSQLMWHIPGVDVRPFCGDLGCFDLPVVSGAPPRHGGSVSVSPGAGIGGLSGGQVAQLNRGLASCPMQVYVNGINMRVVKFGPGRPQVMDGMDNIVSPWEVAAVEVYRRASEMPAEFTGSDAQCGVVAIWTR